MFTVLAGRWLTAIVWFFICCWCFRTIRNIFLTLITMTKNVRKVDAIGIKYHLLAIKNFGKTVTVEKIHKAIVVWNTRGTVTIVLYRRWRVSAKSRSIDTAAKMAKETPDVVKPNRDWTTFKVQNRASEILLKFRYFIPHKKRLRYKAHKKIRNRKTTQKDERWRMKISGFSNHKYNNKVSYACKQRKERVEDTCYNICNEDFFCAIKVKLIFKEETVFFCIVHSEQSVLPDELKPVFLYLVPFHGVSDRIRSLFFFIVFLLLWCSYTNQNSFYEWEKTYVDQFN